MSYWYVVLGIIGIVVCGVTVFFVIATWSLWKASQQKTFYVNTPTDIIDSMLRSLEITSTDRLADLGCGNGSVLRKAVSLYGIPSIGYEVLWWPFLSARLKNKWFVLRHPNLKNHLQVNRTSAEKADLSKISRVFLYTSPSLNQTLSVTLKTDLPYGSKIVSLTFPLPGWEPIETKTVQDYTYWVYKK